jgi:hypothetical protein
VSLACTARPRDSWHARTRASAWSPMSVGGTFESLRGISNRRAFADVRSSATSQETNTLRYLA